MIKWIKIEDYMLPSNSRHVLVQFNDAHGKPKFARARYYRENECELSADLDVYDGCTYDEAETPYVPAGWYENNESEEIHWHLSGVTHWVDVELAKDSK